MVYGEEPREEKARYWVRFFMTRMASRDRGLHIAINELCTHSRYRWVVGVRGIGVVVDGSFIYSTHSHSLFYSRLFSLALFHSRLISFKYVSQPNILFYVSLPHQYVVRMIQYC